MFEQEIARLAALIREAVTKYKEANPVPTRRHMRVRRRDFSLKYLEDFGFGNFTPERMEEDVWDWSDAERFKDAIVKGLEEYKSLVSAVGARANLVGVCARLLALLLSNSDI